MTCTDRSPMITRFSATPGPASIAPKSTAYNPTPWTFIGVNQDAMALDDGTAWETGSPMLPSSTITGNRPSSRHTKTSSPHSCGVAGRGRKIALCPGITRKAWNWSTKQTPLQVLWSIGTLVTACNLATARARSYRHPRPAPMIESLVMGSWLHWRVSQR